MVPVRETPCTSIIIASSQKNSFERTLTNANQCSQTRHLLVFWSATLQQKLEQKETMRRYTLPRGAPTPDPVANIILIIPCQTPRSRRGTMSLIMMLTTVVIPPPPTPWKILQRRLANATSSQLSAYPCSDQLIDISRQTATDTPNPKDGISKE
jgi:hypothetical protein